MFQLKFTTTNNYQRLYPGIQSKLLSAKYKKCSIYGVCNHITLVTYQEK